MWGGHCVAKVGFYQPTLRAPVQATTFWKEAISVNYLCHSLEFSVSSISLRWALWTSYMEWVSIACTSSVSQIPELGCIHLKLPVSSTGNPSTRVCTSSVPNGHGQTKRTRILDKKDEDQHDGDLTLCQSQNIPSSSTPLRYYYPCFKNEITKILSLFKSLNKKMTDPSWSPCIWPKPILSTSLS
jgi:hypothetical protein